ncbi:MAG: hypothetical protein M0P14_02985 [Alkaliphilus sp.]|nr:hypothetical protein [Alkaliphilus sp.]
MAKEISNEQLFEFMTKMYGEMQEGFSNVRSEMQEGFKEVNLRVDNLESEVKETKDRVIIIEQEHGKRLDALFDGYKQNSNKLDRIEEEVSKHEEIILRRIK